MKKLTLIFLVILFLSNTVFAKVLPTPPTNGYPVIDMTAVGQMGEQLTTMNNQYSEMIKQYNKMQDQYLALQSEINKIAQGNFTQSDITRELNKVDGLIKQANSLDANSYQAGGSQFSKNYYGYSTSSNLNNNSYNDFYKNNVNTTLSTLDNATQAIETDKKNNSATAVDNTINQVRANILNADGTTQAVSSLAEINIEILKQLQSMHMQLAAMAEATNAASAKKIQEEATGKVEFGDVVDKDAKEPVLTYGMHPLPEPSF